jgi:hypothetical protein
MDSLLLITLQAVLGFSFALSLLLQAALTALILPSPPSTQSRYCYFLTFRSLPNEWLWSPVCGWSAVLCGRSVGPDNSSFRPQPLRKESLLHAPSSSVLNWYHCSIQISDGHGLIGSDDCCCERCCTLNFVFRISLLRLRDSLVVCVCLGSLFPCLLPSGASATLANDFLLPTLPVCVILNRSSFTHVAAQCS